MSEALLRSSLSRLSSGDSSKIIVVIRLLRQESTAEIRDLSPAAVKSVNSNCGGALEDGEPNIEDGRMGTFDQAPAPGQPFDPSIRAGGAPSVVPAPGPYCPLKRLRDYQLTNTTKPAKVYNILIKTPRFGHDNPNAESPPASCGVWVAVPAEHNETYQSHCGGFFP